MYSSCLRTMVHHVTQTNRAPALIFLGHRAPSKNPSAFSSSTVNPRSLDYEPWTCIYFPSVLLIWLRQCFIDPLTRSLIVVFFSVPFLIAHHVSLWWNPAPGQHLPVRQHCVEAVSLWRPSDNPVQHRHAVRRADPTASSDRNGSNRCIWRRCVRRKCRTPEAIRIDIRKFTGPQDYCRLKCFWAAAAATARKCIRLHATETAG